MRASTKGADFQASSKENSNPAAQKVNDVRRSRDDPGLLEKKHGVSNLKLQMMDKTLVKAADEAEAKRIMEDHFEEHAEHQKQLERERQRSVRASSERHKRRR